MRRRVPNALLALALLLPSMVWAEWLLEIKGLASNQGQILVAVYDASGDKSWLDAPIYQIALDASLAKNGVLTHTLAALEAGDYAVRLFHDENNNQRLDTAANGIPLESFAFSAQGPFTGVPTIEQAAFEVIGNAAHIELVLRHPQQRAAQ